MNRGGCDGQGSSNRKEDTAEDRHQGQALSLRPLPQTKPQARQDARPVVLSELPECSGRASLMNSAVISFGFHRKSMMGKSVGGLLSLSEERDRNLDNGKSDREYQ